MSNILIPTGNFIKSSCTTAYFTLQFDINKTKFEIDLSASTRNKQYSSTSNKQETPTFPNVVCPTEDNMNASADAFFNKLLLPK